MTLNLPSPKIWASDNTDVFSRMSIQQGTSLVYPLSTIGSHITEVPNHQTQRLATLKTRFLIALFGTFGLELDVRLPHPSPHHSTRWWRVIRPGVRAPAREHGGATGP